MHGKVVKTLVNEYKGIGRYEVKFNASDLASGMYIYQLKANGFIPAKDDSSEVSFAGKFQYLNEFKFRFKFKYFPS